ncbi:MAG: hypothetical protein QXJ07_05815 [Candidatus Bathyarchaeia archaeon]
MKKSEYGFSKKLKVVGNVGVQRNPEKDDTAYIPDEYVSPRT